MNPATLQNIKSIAEQLDEICGDDERLFTDMMEGESNIVEIAEHLHQERAQTLETLTGIAEREKNLSARKSRLQAKEEAIKAAIGKLLRAGKLSKVELAEVTYSVRSGASKLEIVNESAVPTHLCRTPRPVPEKTRINEVFADAKELPNWLTRTDPQDVVTARTK